MVTEMDKVVRYRNYIFYDIDSVSIAGWDKSASLSVTVCVIDITFCIKIQQF